jgi:hypothetical protein
MRAMTLRNLTLAAGLCAINALQKGFALCESQVENQSFAHPFDMVF